PPDYFEEPIIIAHSDYTMSIGDGKTEAKIDAAIYDANPSMRDDLHQLLNCRFLGVQLVSHRDYELTNSPNAIRLHPDGHRTISVEVIGAAAVIIGGRADFQHIDASGNVIFDSKRDRIERQKHFADLVSKH